MDKSISAFLDSGESTIRHKALDDCNAIEQCAAEFVFAPAISSSISLCDLTATIEKLAERRGLLRAREIAEMKESLEEFIDKKSSLTCGGEEKKAPCSKKTRKWRRRQKNAYETRACGEKLLESLESAIALIARKSSQADKTSIACRIARKRIRPSANGVDIWLTRATAIAICCLALSCILHAAWGIAAISHLFG